MNKQSAGPVPYYGKTPPRFRRSRRCEDAGDDQDAGVCSATVPRKPASCPCKWTKPRRCSATPANARDGHHQGLASGRNARGRHLGHVCDRRLPEIHGQHPVAAVVHIARDCDHRRRARHAVPLQRTYPIPRRCRPEEAAPVFWREPTRDLSSMSTRRYVSIVPSMIAGHSPLMKSAAPLRMNTPRAPGDSDQDFARGSA